MHISKIFTINQGPLVRRKTDGNGFIGNVLVRILYSLSLFSLVDTLQYIWQDNWTAGKGIFIYWQSKLIAHALLGKWVLTAARELGRGKHNIFPTLALISCEQKEYKSQWGGEGAYRHNNIGFNCEHWAHLSSPHLLHHPNPLSRSYCQLIPASVTTQSVERTQTIPSTLASSHLNIWNVFTLLFAKILIWLACVWCPWVHDGIDCVFVTIPSLSTFSLQSSPHPSNWYAN